ncbi:unnamed protein product [marine sediment metagenome]|uniref:Uncharacterized protein n=1 Tax=marine sediment metagenome TaxID=412755 RepID=X1IMF6_9ZZZZ
MLKMKTGKGPASYATATPPTMTFGEFEKVSQAVAAIGGPNTAQVVSIAGNVVTYRIYESAGSAAPHAETTDADNFSTIDVTIIADGY